MQQKTVYAKAREQLANRYKKARYPRLWVVDTDLLCIQVLCKQIQFSLHLATQVCSEKK